MIISEMKEIWPDCHSVLLTRAMELLEKSDASIGLMHNFRRRTKSEHLFSARKYTRIVSFISLGVRYFMFLLSFSFGKIYSREKHPSHLSHKLRGIVLLECFLKCNVVNYSYPCPQRDSKIWRFQRIKFSKVIASF